MGRKKIQITRINDERNRQVTFTKRKFGLMKKAYELSVLCDCEIALIIFTSNNKLYQYASSDMDKVLLKYTEYNDTVVSQTNKEIVELLSKKEKGSESPDHDEEYVLTPRTEETYKQIDAEYARVMQTTVRQPTISHYQSLPVTVPITNYAHQSSSGTSSGRTVVAGGSGSHNTVVSLPSQHNGQPTAAVPARYSPVPSTSGSKSSAGGDSSPPSSLSVTQRVEDSSSPGLVTDKEVHVQLPSQSHQQTLKNRPDLRILIPPKTHADIIAGQLRSGTSALDTPLVSVATPGNQISSHPSNLPSLLTADLQLNTADLAGLIGTNSPLLAHWGAQGPLTAAVHASGLHLAPGPITLTSSLAAGKPLSALGIKSEPISPPQMSPTQPIQQLHTCTVVRQLSPHNPSPAPDQDEPSEKKPRVTGEG